MDQVRVRDLFVAAMEGDVAYLMNMIKSDKLLLDRVFLPAGPYTETPLHIASFLGHLEFVQVIVDLMPELASKLDTQRSSPLHIAAAKGFFDIVKTLVAAKPEMCFVRDRNGKNPLHVAAARGHVYVLKELMGVKPAAARDIACNGETILHLCVKHKKWEVLKFLVSNMNDHEFVNSKDYDGNTILHLAAANGEKEWMNFLIRQTQVEIHTPNLSGHTSFNVLAEMEFPEIEPISNYGYRHTKGKGCGEDSHDMFLDSGHPATMKPEGNDWFEQKKSVLMVVASLIATMAFQAAISPPGGVWEQDSYDNEKRKVHEAGTSKLASFSYMVYLIYFSFNTIGFVASMSIILLLISGIRLLNRKVFMWVYMVIMWVAVSAVSLAYGTYFAVLTPSTYGHKNSLFRLSVCLQVWGYMMLLLLPGNFIHLLVKFIKRKIRPTTYNRPSGV